MTKTRLDNFWGTKGVPLLPKSVRLAWADLPIPQWVKDDLQLSDDARISAFDESVWQSGLDSLSPRVRNYLLNLISTKRGELRGLQVFADAWPYWLDPAKLRYSTRTQNCLSNGGLIADRAHLSAITFHHLFETPSMGTVSILEFVCLSEAAFDQKDETNEAGAEEPLNKEELAKLVFEPWADQIGSADPRFSDLLPADTHDTLYQAIVSFVGRPDEDRKSLRRLAASIPQVRDRLAKIDSLPLEQQLMGFLQAVSRLEGTRLVALGDRLGLRGTPPITLEETGSRLGVTRERVRQLQERVTQRLSSITFPVYMPALDKALNLLRATGPLGIDEASKLSRANSLSDINFHPASIIAAAEFCGRKPPICVQTVNKKAVVTTTTFPNADEIIYTAHRQAQASGASNIAEVVAELHSKKLVVAEEIVLHVLRELSDVRFFEDQWFCRRPPNPNRDRLRNVTRKMLSVASPIELGEVREGIRREYRYRGHRGMKTWTLIVPPRSVLRNYYQTHPEFVIDGDDVKSADPLDYRTELSFNDAILVDALRMSPACVLDRSSLSSECTRRGMNPNTFSLYVTYSPVIVHLGTDIWSLRGVKVDPTAVEAVRTANALRQKEKRVLDHGWTTEGKLWMAARLPTVHSGNFVFGIPGAIKRFLVGRQFAIRDEGDLVRGAIRINDEGSSYGFGAFLHRRGADAGDILIVEFDLSRSEALLRLGNDELLDELSPET